MCTFCVDLLAIAPLSPIPLAAGVLPVASPCLPDQWSAAAAAFGLPGTVDDDAGCVGAVVTND